MGKTNTGAAFRLAAEFAASVTGALLGRALMARLGLGYMVPLPADLGGAVAVTIFLSLRHRRNP
jgi:hypothetical protein